MSQQNDRKVPGDDRQSQDFLPTADWETLRFRSDLLQRIRQFFLQREFIEVETPILSQDTVIDRHLEPFAVEGLVTESDSRAWLQTSPEFAMKRMMAAGGEAIFQLARVFRQGECGRMHNPEFTMLEWYRKGDDLQGGMTLLADFACEFLNVSEVIQQNYRDAFLEHLDVDPFVGTIAELSAAAKLHSISVPWKSQHPDRDDWLNLLFSEVVQVNLGNGNPVMVYDWPASQSALAIVRDGKIPVAERFELFHRGVELANGYHELVDADELARRNRIVNKQRESDGLQMLPEHSRMLDAMHWGLPQCVGVALGIDRLLMCLLGVNDISEVIAFPIDRA